MNTSYRISTLSSGLNADSYWQYATFQAEKRLRVNSWKLGYRRKYSLNNHIWHECNNSLNIYFKVNLKN